MLEKIGIIGNGYWGNKIRSKLNPRSILFISSKPSEYYPLIDSADWVIVASPEYTHFEIVKNALALGKNVFCEKPLALAYDEYFYLYELADQQGVKLYVDDVFAYCNSRFEFELINKVEWFKSSHRIKKHVRELLFRLAYHDIYLLYPYLKNFDLVDLKNESTNSILKWTSYHEEGVTVSFEYNDSSDEWLHEINGSFIGCQKSDDPLKKMLLNVLNFDVDFDSNKLSTLFVGCYLDKVKEIV